MLKKLVAAGVLLGIGYVAGVYFGFKAAVTDYVEGDAEKLESAAADIYDERETEDGPETVGELLNAVKEDEDEDNDGPTAFN